MVIIKCNALLNCEQRRKLEINIHDQAADGVIVLPECCELLNEVPADEEIKIIHQDTRVAVPEHARWIPVYEDLPETIACGPAGTAYSEAVIVWTSGKKAMIAVWNGEDFLCAADYWEAWDENVTHWMPLPTPPKEA